jgi:hypothetical protein
MSPMNLNVELIDIVVFVGKFTEIIELSYNLSVSKIYSTRIISKIIRYRRVQEVIKSLTALSSVLISFHVKTRSKWMFHPE